MCGLCGGALSGARRWGYWISPLGPKCAIYFLCLFPWSRLRVNEACCRRTRMDAKALRESRAAAEKSSCRPVGCGSSRPNALCFKHGPTKQHDLGGSVLYLLRGALPRPYRGALHIGPAALPLRWCLLDNILLLQAERTERRRLPTSVQHVL